MAKGENTRSGLLWEVERLLNECEELPQVLLMENVTQVHGKNNLEHFQEWIDFLESKGYSNFWKDLNAKNFGIPQNRDRCFMVSILGDYRYEFPREIPLKLRLKDMLEDSVDERFYISDVALKGFIEHERKQREKGNSFHATIKNENEIASTIKARYYKDGSDCLIQVDTEGLAPTVKENHGTVTAIIEPTRLGYIPYPNSDKPHQSNTFYDTNAISSTLDTCEGGNRQVKIAEPVMYQAPHGYMKGNMQKVCPSITTSSWESNNFLVEPLAYDEQNGYIRKDGIVGTLTTDGSSPKHNNRVVESEMRIRKLTPRECYRLMGFDDADFEKAAQCNSNSQLYKQAGNSIVVDVLYYIFGAML